MTPKQQPCSLRSANAGGDCCPRRDRGFISPAFPLTSPDENDAMVNAIQRLTAVVVKKSLQEGFGLGVTEAMWKARPVVASAVGGHLEQIEHLHSRLLVSTLLIPERSAMRSSSFCENLLWPPASARQGANGFAPCFNDWHFVRWPRSSARRSNGVPVQPGPRSPRRACRTEHRSTRERSILPTAII